MNTSTKVVNSTFIPRDYQESLSDKASSILNRLKIVALIMEVRTGKTITSFLTAEKSKCKKVLFITKKKVIESNTILNDYNLVNPSFELTQINYESVHKVKGNFDLFIIDESHSLGAFPKPSIRTKRIKELIGKSKLILLSGTITPESWSQIYHQFWISDFTPFVEKSFYQWAKNYVNVTQKFVAHGNKANDYSKANENLIRQKLSKYIVSFSQKEAGFSSSVKEHILYVRMKPTTYQLIRKIEKDLVFEGKNGGVILADTPVKKMQKIHQLFSGTIKLEDGSSTIIDDTKARFIKEKFSNKKIAIFYKFKEELNLLKQVFQDELTTGLQEFKTTNKNIALQFISGREGISLKEADCIVAYNIDFSATTYFQFKDRLTTKERLENNLYWIFSKNGLEKEIYKTVLDKKSFTLNHYKNVRINPPK